MADHAMVWTTSLGYMPGTNAILNALELYGFEGIDVHVLVKEDESLPEGYAERFPDVHFEGIDHRFWHESKSAFWYLVFADLDYALRELFDKYRVVLFWGADVCVVNNFQRWFDVAERLDTVVLGTNEQNGGDPDKLERLSRERPYRHTWDVPYADIPMFIPESRREVVRLTLDYQREEGVRLSRMDGLNYAVRDLGERVFTVPGVYWILNVPTMAQIEWLNHHLYLHGTRMESFHRKYWQAKFCGKYFGNVDSRVRTDNIITMNRVWNFLNRDCRVKWEDGVETWDGN